MVGKPQNWSRLVAAVQYINPMSQKHVTLNGLINNRLDSFAVFVQAQQWIPFWIFVFKHERAACQCKLSSALLWKSHFGEIVVFIYCSGPFNLFSFQNVFVFVFDWLLWNFNCDKEPCHHRLPGLLLLSIIVHSFYLSSIFYLSISLVFSLMGETL